jgi:hypothetical protein
MSISYECDVSKIKFHQNRKHFIYVILFLLGILFKIACLLVYDLLISDVPQTTGYRYGNRLFYYRPACTGRRCQEHRLEFVLFCMDNSFHGFYNSVKDG